MPNTPPIAIVLSKFEQIEILRAETELRERELKQIEKQIKDCMFELERQRYLQTIHPVFQQLPPPESASTLPQLHANRDLLSEAVQAMQTALTQLQSETAGQAAPPSRNPGIRPGAAGPGPAGSSGGAQPAIGAPRRAKFDNFDEFRANKAGGGGQ